MRIDDTKWNELRQAVSADDQSRFRALVWSLVRAGIREHEDTRQMTAPHLSDGRPFLARFQLQFSNQLLE